MQHWGPRHNGRGQSEECGPVLDRESSPTEGNVERVRRCLPEAIDLAQLESLRVGHSHSAGSHHVQSHALV